MLNDIKFVLLFNKSKSFFNTNLKSMLLSIPIYIKNVFDFFLGVNSISSTSTLFFIFFSLPYLWKNKWYIACVVLFIPALYMDFLTLRIILTFSLFFIFFHLIKSNDEYISEHLFYLICFLSLSIILGLFIPDYYTVYGDEYKYRFIYNDPNNFGPYGVAYLAVLIYYSSKLKYDLKKIVVIFLIFGLYVALTQIKGRLYGAIGTAEMLLFFYFLRQSDISKKAFYIGSAIFAFLAIFWLYQIGLIPIGQISQISLDKDIISLTGRDMLCKAFFEHLNNTPLSSLLYGSTYSEYAPIASDYIKNSTHSYVENSYYAVVLFGGCSTLIIMLFLQSYLLYILYIHGARVTLLFVFLYYCVFFFDDSLIYPISVFHQLLSIYALYKYELAYAK